MAGTFPTLKSGNVAWYPLADTTSYGTKVVTFQNDTEQRWRHRLPLKRFQMTCNNISWYDACSIMTFYRSQFGRFDLWTLELGGETYDNLSFGNDGLKFTEAVRNRASLSFEVVQRISDSPAIPAFTGTYFPQLPNGTITCLPYSVEYDYRTTIAELIGGNMNVYKWRSEPLSRFNVQLSNLTPDELALVKDFFASREGRLREFGFLNPNGNLVEYSDNFGHASWIKSGVSVGGAQTDPFGGNLAVRVSSTGGFLYTPVITNGNGVTLCCSAWAKATAPDQSIAIGFVDNTLTLIGKSTYVLPEDQWVRVRHTETLSTNVQVRMRIGDGVSWLTGEAVDLFSAQTVPTPGPGPRLLTPGFKGLYTKCRFATDSFPVVHTAFGLNSLEIPVVEYS
jgi:hypothetical protein